MVAVEADSTIAPVVHVGDSDHADPYELVTNRGRNQGVKLGDRFLVFTFGPGMFDYETRESLGRIEIVRGRGEVIHVRDNLSTPRSVEQKPGSPGKRIVRMHGRFGRETEEELPREILPFKGAARGDLVKAR